MILCFIVPKNYEIVQFKNNMCRRKSVKWNVPLSPSPWYPVLLFASPRSRCCDQKSHRSRTNNSHRLLWRTRGNRSIHRILHYRLHKGWSSWPNSIFLCVAKQNEYITTWNSHFSITIRIIFFVLKTEKLTLILKAKLCHGISFFTYLPWHLVYQFHTLDQ